MIFKQLTMCDLLGWFLQKQEESFVYLWNAWVQMEIEKQPVNISPH